MMSVRWKRPCVPACVCVVAEVVRRDSTNVLFTFLDLADVINYLVKSRCSMVSSFGTLKVFKPSRKPAGAGDRCLDCAVESDCPYSAKKLYLEQVSLGYTGWPVEVIVDGSTWSSQGDVG